MNKKNHFNCFDYSTGYDWWYYWSYDYAEWQ